MTSVNLKTNEILFVKSGEEYFDILKKMIADAKKDIHFQTYIFEDDYIGNEILNRLLDAAKRGIKVYLVLDLFGSKNIFFKIKKINSVNFYVKFFGRLQFRHLLFAGRRLHHKVICTDGEKSLIGGINIADKYYGTSDEPAWLDHAIYFENQWSRIVKDICNSIYLREFNVKYQLKEKRKLLEMPNNPLWVLQNDWMRRRNEIYESYLSLIHCAKVEILIMNAYFLPGRRLLRALKKATMKGVNVKIILGKKSDVPLIRYAIMHSYNLLSKYKIEIYEWEKSIIHAKSMLVDNQYFMTGSFNLNFLSQFGSIEMNVLCYHTKIISKAREEFNFIIEHSEKISPLIMEKLHVRVLSFLAYQVIRLALKLLVWFPFYKARKKKWKLED